MNRPVSTIIDRDLCTGCGLCVKVCPLDTISIIDNKAVITGNESLYCDHCVAVCPVNATKIDFTDDEQMKFANFSQPKGWIEFGEYSVESLVHLMRSRRSCRNFKQKAVDISILKDLVKTGTTAPSGTNCQMWTFTILPDRDSVLKFGAGILGFFKKLNKMAEKKWLRKFLCILGKRELNEYYEGYYEKVSEKIREFEEDKKDGLFHGAVSAILVGSEPGASCPSEDALLATQNILLGAHAMGLGTCLIGFAVEAMKNDKGLKKIINIPKNEKIYSVIALGYPNEKYRDCSGRKKITPRISKI